MKLIGTINKHIDVGYYLKENSFLIMSNSNCIRFNENELNCLMAVLTILSILPVDDAVEWFYKHRIALFEPAPPPAEIRII